MFVLILLPLTMPPLKEIEKIKSSGKGMAVSKKVNNGKCLLPVVNGTHLNNYLFMFISSSLHDSEIPYLMGLI